MEPRSVTSLMRSRNVHSRGVALILVLAMLVLLSALIVAFMTSATNERSSTVASSSATASRQIADSTVNLVMSQIREATTQAGASSTGGAIPSETAAWASQPGAIRTFTGEQSQAKVTNAAGATYPTYKAGNSDTVYKLYSSDRMRVSASEYASRDLPDEVDTIENWDRDEPTKDHVDLNQPVLRQITDAENVVEPRYPIIDPRARFDENDKPTSGSAPGIVDGFDMRAGIQDQTLLLAGGGGKVPYLPLPVKWLYVLADGTMGAADRATLQNPIVGRTAFWVDDETSKLNINTASEGTYWDTPTASTKMESGAVTSGKALEFVAGSLSLAASQPVRGEYQRYPGHPATTSLSPVLGWLGGLKPLKSSDKTPELRDLKDFKEMIYKLTPFIPNGMLTSLGGTDNPDRHFTGNELKPPALTYATKRLYTTVDELIFNDERTRGSENPVTQLNTVSPKSNGANRLTPEALERVRFFLTVSSRAPELNLFGRPRMTIWPVNAELARRTSFDDLFAFTSTIGTQPYYFTRSDAKDPVNDFNASNQRMFEYLKSLTGDGGKDIPGFGSSFASKYGGAGLTMGSERDQILTMMLDYMRTVNLVDTGTSERATTSAKFRPYTPFYGPTGYSDTARPFEWSGQVTPLQVVGASGQVKNMGLGRFVTLSEAALIFYRKGNPVAGDPQPSQMEATLALELATPMPGYPALKETFFTVVRALRPTKIKFGATGQESDMGFSPERLVNICSVPSHQVAYGRGFMPILGFGAQMHYYDDHKGPTDPFLLSDPNRSTSGTVRPKIFQRHPSTVFGQYKRGTSPGDATQTSRYYPYVSDAFAVGKNKTFEFSGGSFEVEIWSGEAPPINKGDPRARLVQTITLNFPEKFLSLPVPTVITPGTNASFQARLSSDAWNYLDSGKYDDVVRSLEFTGGVAPGGLGTPFTSVRNKGDLRLGMARATVPATFYEPRANYLSTSIKRIHGLTCGHGDPLSGHTAYGLLAAGGVTRTENGPKPPILPSGINGVTRLDGGPGDWDRGLSKHMDGAFGNKVDEGNVFFNYTDSPGGRIPYFRGKGIEETGRSYFSPNRQIASAVMFGSLPTGVIRGEPWQTLLFRPNRERNTSHPGAKFPQDHLFLDLFHIPVVEPYAISEPFSTAGKVNLNYVIAPFGYAKGGGGTNQDAKNERSYLRRDTALRGVLKSTKIMAVPTKERDGGHHEDPHAVQTQLRHDIDLNRTLEHFENRLKDPARGLFRSTSEICEMDLYPRGLNVADWDRFWNTDYAQTGDNMRERPYAHIYPRLTTRSNVYTVHMRCQVLKKVPGTKHGDFVEGQDKVLGEYRGSTTIERFIDPNDPDLKNYDATSQSAEPYYRFRIVGSKQFTGN